MDILIKIGQLLLSLSLLIVLHEFGHFLPARAFKTRVEKFYLFFDAGFSLFKKKIGETEWGIGWLPLGGYVKISGMIDESFDTEQMESEPQPWEFRSKPAWQRLIIMLGGVTVNFILGFFIFGMIFWYYGEEYLPAKSAEYGIHADSLGMEIGLATGDKILKIGEADFERFSDRTLLKAIAIDNVNSVTVDRGGREQVVTIDPKWSDLLTRYENKNERLFTVRQPTMVTVVSDGSPAQKAGMLPLDRLVAVEGESTPFYDQFTEAVKDRANETLTFTILRNEQQDTIELVATLNDDAKLGIGIAPPTDFFATERADYTLGEAIPAGVTRGVNFLGDQVKSFGQMFRGKIKASESLGGFASIAGMFGTTWDWERFWTMTAVLSLILAFMNLLPIPALDGGHVMFLLYEVVTGRKPSDKFLEKATMVGFILVLALLVYANGLDIWRSFFK
ncbi:RIP metalloprotease RseP [Lewinellaceae bacterium SD302]|nr:RIP metalloprotease RseP [Lewinellaceae bacterium SD302]